MSTEPIRILVVEGNPADARQLCEAMAQAGPWQCQIEVVGCLQEALAWVARHCVDAILLDLGLPEGGGLDCLERMRSAAPSLPIVVLAAQDDAEMALATVAKGAQDCLVKGQADGRQVARALRCGIHRKRAAEQTEQQLQALNETLERRVAERTAEAKQRADQLRTLASELTQAEERERRRMARILHDHLQQLLVGARYKLEALREDLRQESSRTAGRQLDELLHEAIKVTRSLTVELSPPCLYEKGMADVLCWLSRWMEEKHGLLVKVDADGQINPRAEDMRVLLFQAVRELLFNIVKHAGVNHASVHMRRVDDTQIQIVVADEGLGFDPSQHYVSTDPVVTGLGLFSIRERLELMGGQLVVDSAPGRGTRVTLLAPVMFEPSAEVLPAPVSKPMYVPMVPPPPIATSPAGLKLRVLLAEDREIVRQSMVSLLQRQHDMELIAQVADGPKALELARRLRPDVLVVRGDMPGMCSLGAVQLLASTLPQCRLVALSDHQGIPPANPAIPATWVSLHDSLSVLLGAIRGWPASPDPAGRLPADQAGQPILGAPG